MSFERQNSLNANECGRAKIKEATTPSTTTPSTNTTSLSWKWQKIRKRWGWSQFLSEVFNQEQIICPGSKNKKHQSSEQYLTIFHLPFATLGFQKMEKKNLFGCWYIDHPQNKLSFPLSVCDKKKHKNQSLASSNLSELYISRLKSDI